MASAYQPLLIVAICGHCHSPHNLGRPASAVWTRGWFYRLDSDTIDIWRPHVSDLGSVTPKSVTLFGVVMANPSASYFRIIYDMYKRSVYRFCRRMLTDEAAAKMVKTGWE